MNKAPGKFIWAKPRISEITSTYFLLARTQSYGPPQLQGSLGDEVQDAFRRQEERSPWQITFSALLSSTDCLL